jgi:hypothetical protein
MLDAACNLLSAVYNWFTEGFDTKDLQEAKALLEELEGKKPKRRSKRPSQRKEQRTLDWKTRSKKKEK